MKGLKNIGNEYRSETGQSFLHRKTTSFKDSDQVHEWEVNDLVPFTPTEILIQTLSSQYLEREREKFSTSE